MQLVRRVGINLINISQHDAAINTIKSFIDSI